MVLLQLSAGQGPVESCRALALALMRIEREALTLKLKLTLLESTPGPKKGSFKSLLLTLEGANAKDLGQRWQGSMQWICPSPYRPGHKRKNWFFGGQLYEPNSTNYSGEIEYKTCRASGAGGQHVNTTDSAVRATHIASGISVRVECERSQHANKKLAQLLIARKLEQQEQMRQSQQEQKLWQQHWALERGNPVRVFIGERFTSRD